MQSSSTLPSSLAYPHPGRSPVPGHLRPVLRPRRAPLRHPHLPLPLGTEAPVHRPPAPRQGTAPRRAGPHRPDPVAPRPARGLPLPRRPGPAQTAGHPRPARRDRQGAPRPAHLPHLRDRKALLHPPLARRMPRLHRKVTPLMTTPARHLRSVNATWQADRSCPGRPARRPRPPRPGRPRHPHPARLRPRAGHPPPLPARRPGRSHRQIHLRDPDRLHHRRRRYRPAHPARHQRRSRRR